MEHIISYGDHGNVFVVVVFVDVVDVVVEGEIRVVDDVDDDMIM
jgi:hypothetical protein